MQFLKHMSENLFITLTGIAALVHSTWSLGTFFSGVQPQGDWWAYAMWVLPAFFVAFAMDVGQISTSAAIRHNGLTWQRAVTFFVFAIATYYLQFLYLAHHTPLVDIAAGVSGLHRPAVEIAVNARIWILPLLLPFATMLYTLSDGDKKEQPIKQQHPEPTILVESPEKPMLEEKSTDTASISLELIPQAKFSAYCEDCGWTKEYEDSTKAARALNTHKSIHCKAKHLESVVASNGHLSEANHG